MQITDDLRLVLPLRRDAKGEPVVLGYHTPISRETYEASYRILAATKAALFAKGTAFAADVGPQIAALRLRDEARQDARDQGDIDNEGKGRDTVAVALLADLRRLTMVMCATPTGWEPIPVDIAISRGVMDLDDWRDAEGGLVFFTCSYAMATKTTRRGISEAVAGVMGASITSLPLTEFVASLTTQTMDAPMTPAASSVPV